MTRPHTIPITFNGALHSAAPENLNWYFADVRQGDLGETRKFHIDEVCQIFSASVPETEGGSSSGEGSAPIPARAGAAAASFCVPANAEGSGRA